MYDETVWDNTIHLDGFEGKAIQKRVILELLKRMKNTEQADASPTVLESIISLIDKRAGAKVNVAGNIVVVKGYNTLKFFKAEELEEIKDETVEVALEEGAVFIGETKLVVENVYNTTITNTPDTMYIPSVDASSFVLRLVREKDMYRKDSNKSKKLRRVLTDMKVPQEERSKKIVLAKGNEVHWIEGVVGTRYEERFGNFVKITVV